MRFIALAALALLLNLPTVAQDEAVYPEVIVSSDLTQLPKAVQRKREALIAAAKSGDIEALRPIIATQLSPPTVSYGGPEDAVDYLKSTSTDGEGIQILALLLNLLDAPYAVFDADGDNPSYVWPYLAALPDLSHLTAEQKVDAYRLLDHDSVVQLIELQSWYDWRIYIGGDGEWQAFVAGD